MRDHLAGAIRRDRGLTRSRRTATVSAVDGQRVTVTMGGGEVVVDGYLEGYTPTVGDTVILLREESSWLLLGRAIGTGETAGTEATVQPRGVIGTVHMTGFSGTMALANAAGEFPLAAWTNVGEFSFDPGRIYQLHVRTGAYNTGAGIGLSNIRIRQGLGLTTGQQLLSIRAVTPANSQVCSIEQFGYVANLGDKVVFTDLGMSIERVVVSGNAGLYADGNIPAHVVVTDVGSVVGNVPLADAATALI